MYKVYVKTTADGFINFLDSDAYLCSTDGLTCIDEGDGDRFKNAAQQYLDGGIEAGTVLRYRLVDGLPKLREDLDSAISAVAKSRELAEARRNLAASSEKLLEALEVILSCTSALDLIAKLATLRTTFAATLSGRATWRVKIKALGG